MPTRTTDTSVSSHLRLVTRTVVGALRTVFGNYPRDPQLRNLKVTPTYPLKRLDYPCIVVEYEPQKVINAGIGHEEWFPDANNVLRKWHHSRFEGMLTFNVLCLSPLDLDILADALVEIIRFGRLDPQLLPFFDTIYGAATDPVKLLFSQIAVNSDEVDFGGTSVSIAPWAPEDVLVYERTCSTSVHGGYYNVVPTDTWSYITRARAEPYPQGEQSVVIPFGDKSVPWTNPFEYVDATIVRGKAVFPRFVGDEYVTPMIDTGVLVGTAAISGVDSATLNDAVSVIGKAVITGVDSKIP